MSKGKGEGKCMRKLQSILAWLEQDRQVDEVGKMSWNWMVKEVNIKPRSLDISPSDGRQ